MFVVIKTVFEATGYHTDKVNSYHKFYTVPLIKTYTTQAKAYEAVEKLLKSKIDSFSYVQKNKKAFDLSNFDYSDYACGCISDNGVQYCDFKIIEVPIIDEFHKGNKEIMFLDDFEM